ncbi:hypothetical protein FHG66_09830 [Rubellimicrobium rubrum]|uniref:Uncharacterized protein n=1 Tax=Rubellimicrobium rubrum TaxID=2585369 RepID=A0A5C4MWN7_9RHOB|nr:hypothetical protein [Rubellimicrobium rubrum]TNC49805.1 hypothetical protein FHG66_09830 [Rubellimicrobium rubrum]
MTPPVLQSRRHALGLLGWTLVLGATPAGLWGAGPAWARDGEDDSGRGNGRDRDDDDRDDGDGQGRGRGRGRGGDDGPDDRDDHGRAGGQGPGAREGSPTSEGGSRDNGQRLRDVTVRYSDGWVERIVSGRYELIDHQSRLVVRRTATADDFTRMIALR